MWLSADCFMCENKMKYNSVNLRRNEIISMIAATFIFMIKGMGLYDGQRIFACFLAVLFLLLAMKYAGETLFTGELAVYAVFSVVALYSYYLSRDKGLLLCFCMILLVKNCNIDSVIKAGALSLGAFGTFRGILSITGVLENKVLLHDKLGGEILRYSFGQPHPNVLHMTYLILCCMVLYCLRKDKKRLFFWNVLFMVGSIVLFLYTVSYTGLLLSILLFALVALWVHIPRITAFDWFISFAILLGTVSFSVVFPQIINYDNGITQSFILSIYNRFRLLNRYFSAYSVTVWGQNISDYTKVSYQLDNSWATLLLSSGGVIFCLMVVFYGVGLFLLLKQGRKLEVYIVLLLLIGGMSDPFLFNTSLKNIGLLFMGSAIYDGLYRKEGKRIMLLPTWHQFLNQYVEIRIPVWNVRNKLSGVQVFLVGIVALLASLCIMHFVHMPQIYCVAGKDPIREGVAIEQVYVTQDVLKDSSVRVYSYRDSHTPMWMVDSDRIRRIEYGRMLLGICMVSFLVLYSCGFPERKKGN